MKVLYLDWKEGVRRLQDRMKLLKRIFSVLLIQEDGDVERALQLLKIIGNRYGLFDKDLTFEDFKDSILTEKLVAKTPSGFALTPRGERFIRTESLNQIFSSLKVGSSGDHGTPHTGRGTERLTETRPYQFGDEPSDIDFISSYRNALFHWQNDGLTLIEDDLQVF